MCFASILTNWDSRLQNLFDDDPIMYDKHWKIDQFVDKACQLAEVGAEDVYFSLNSFWKPHRAETDVRHLNAFVIDYDYYKLRKYKNYTAEQMYEVIKDTLPYQPTYVIDSGRGLYVIYCFKHCSKVRLNIYKAIWKQLLITQKSFGADPKATLSTQVIRIPGTLNSKAVDPDCEYESLKEVRIIQENKTNYMLDDFYELLPYSFEQVSDHKSHFVRNTNKKIYRVNRNKTYMDNLIKDFKKLISIRNENGIVEGYREYLLYATRYTCMYYGMSGTEALNIARSLNRKFKCPMKENELVKQTAPTKILSNCITIDKLIENLEIVHEEQLQMITLKSNALKREDEKKAKAYRNKHPLLNRTPKQLELLHRRALVREYLKKGLRKSDIAKQMKTSIQKVNQDIKYIKDHAYEFIDKLEQYLSELNTHIELKIFTRTLNQNSYNYLTEWLKMLEVATE